MKINKLKLLVVFLALGVLSITGCAEKISEEETYAQATEDFDNGKYRAAFIKLKNLLRVNSSNKDARVLLGQSSLKLGDPESAEKEFSRARDLGASDDEIYAYELETMLMLGRNREIVEDFNETRLSKEETRTLARLHYGNALLALGESEQAMAQFQETIDLNLNSNLVSQGYVGLATIARSKGNLKAAVEHIVKAKEIDTNSATPVIALGQIYLSTKEFEKARTEFSSSANFSRLSANQKFMFASGLLESNLGLEDIEQAKIAGNELFKVAPEHPITGFLLSRVAYIDGDKEMAHESVQKVLAKYPEFRPAQMLQGALSLERKEYQQAEMFLSSVVAAQPSNVEARKLLAEAQIQQNKNDEAAANLKFAIENGQEDSEVNNLLGRINLKLNDSENNIEYLEEALRKDPNNDRLKVTLAAAYMSAGDVDKASQKIESISPDGFPASRKELMQFLVVAKKNDLNKAQNLASSLTERWPEDEQVNKVISGWYMTLGNIDKARELFERMAAASPSDPAPVINLARLDGRQNRISQAKSRLERFIKNNPTQKNIDVWMALAFLQRKEDDRAGAIATLEKLFEDNGDSEVVSVVLARLLVVDKDFDRALEVSEMAVNTSPKSASIRTVKGQIHLQQKEYQAALEEFDLAISLLPNNPKILKQKARAEMFLKRYAQAIRTLRQLVDLTPGDFDSVRNLAGLESKAGNQQAAAVLIANLRKEHPNDPRVAEIEGDLKMMEKNEGGAFSDYSKAYKQQQTRSLAVKLSQLAVNSGSESTSYLQQWLEKSPEDVPVRLMLAQQLQKLGRRNDAQTEYEKVLAHAPENALAINNLAWLYYEESGSDAKAKGLQLAERAHALAPESEQIADTYGWLLLRSGDVNKGLEVLSKAQDSAKRRGSPALNDISYHYAVALSESGDKAGARGVLQNILDGEKEFANRDDAKVLLDTLLQ